jgi:hypothetical protein
MPKSQTVIRAALLLTIMGSGSGIIAFLMAMVPLYRSHSTRITRDL